MKITQTMGELAVENRSLRSKNRELQAEVRTLLFRLVSNKMYYLIDASETMTVNLHWCR